MNINYSFSIVLHYLAETMVVLIDRRNNSFHALNQVLKELNPTSQLPDFIEYLMLFFV